MANGDLPNEILGLVFSWLDCIDRRVRAGAVCRLWHDVACDDGAVGRPICLSKGRRSKKKHAALRAARSAAKAIHGGCLRRIFETHPDIDDPMGDIVAAAARADDVAQFVYVCERTRHSCEHAIVEAAAAGAARILAHMINDIGVYRRLFLSRAFDSAVSRGRYQCVALLSPHCIGASWCPVAIAAGRGTTAMIDCLVADEHTLTSIACAAAASHGGLAMLQHLRLLGCP